MFSDDRNRIALVKIWHGDDAGTEHPPLGILSVGGALTKAGYGVSVYHWVKGAIDYSSFDFGARIVGVSVITGDPMGEILQFCRAVKIFAPEMKVVLGGVHPTLCVEQCLAEPNVDFVVTHDGEFRMVQLANLICYGYSMEHVEINGVFWKQDGRLRGFPAVQDDVNLDAYEPDFSLVKVERYVRPYRGLKRVLMGYTVTRGCPHRCGFCYNQKFNRGGWRRTSADVAARRVNNLAKRHNLDGVLFMDDNLTAVRSWFLDFVGKIERTALHIETRIDYMTAKFADALKASGVDVLFFGVESGSDRILKLLDKGFGVERIRKSLRLVDERGIATKLSFIVGVPSETLGEFRETLNLIVWCLENLKHLDGVTLGFYMPYPGTPLYKFAMERGFWPPSKMVGWEKMDRWGYTDQEIGWTDGKWLTSGEVLNLRRLLGWMKRGGVFYRLFRWRFLASGSRVVRWAAPLERLAIGAAKRLKRRKSKDGASR